MNAPAREPDVDDVIVVLLAGTLAALRDQLARDGYEGASELVADLTEAADDWLAGLLR